MGKGTPLNCKVKRLHDLPEDLQDLGINSFASIFHPTDACAAALCRTAPTFLARAHVLDHALAQRADGIGTHGELS